MKINDEQILVSVVNQFGREIPIYDDGYGPLWIHRDSMGILGIVRAQTWEEAYSICEDEFLPEADKTIEEIRAEYNKTRRHAKIIRPADGSGEREAILSDYPLQTSQFVRWETIEMESDDPNAFSENELFQENFGFRPSGPNSTDVLKHGIYSKELNGDDLEELTEELAKSLELIIEVADVE